MTGEHRPWIGQGIPRSEDPAILRGYGSYVADIATKDKGLHARFVRSTVARGRLISVNADNGVTVFTAEDIGSVRDIRSRLARPDFVVTDMPILARDFVRFVGEPIAMVLAETEAEAEDALEKVSVEIEPSDPVLDAARAVDSECPLVHDVEFPNGPNTVVDGQIVTDNVDEAF